MSTEYRIEPVGRQFIVVDPWGEIVDRYPSEKEARQNIERFKKEQAVSERHTFWWRTPSKLSCSAERAIRDAAETSV